MKIIGLAGMPGSGKGVVSSIAEEMDYHIIRMGDIIREEAKKRGEDPGKTAVRLRKEHGEYIIAERCIPKIENIKNGKILIEGIRSPHEVEIFKKHYKGFKVISIFSTQRTRFKRLRKRGRKDDTKDYKKFVERDQRELGFGLGDVIATSDYVIINEGSLHKFKENTKKLLKKITKDC
ncbi:MAG: AAA family ATPase [Methanothermobacter sp.]